MKPSLFLIIIILTMGIIAISTGSIFIKLANQAVGGGSLGFSLVLAGSRLTLASLILLPIWRKMAWENLTKKATYYAILAGVFLAIHFALWITSLSYTSIAASTALVTTNPIWVSLISYFWFGEKIPIKSVLGITIALLGSLTIGWGDMMTENSLLTPENNPLFGDLLALLGAIAVSFYLLLGREAQRLGIGITQYIIIAYTSSAIVLLPWPFFLGLSYTGYPNIVYVYILLMALIPQLIGHTSFNWAIRWISPVLVTLSALFEPVGASFLGYFFFQEIPSFGVIGGAIILLLGVAITALNYPKTEEKS